MLSKVRNLYRSVNGLPEAFRRLESLLEANQTPADRYLALEVLNRSDSLFGQVYGFWLTIRINKIMTIFGGPSYFKGKRVLELGAGHCDIGAFFAELGADVVCLEGRPENINFAQVKHRNVPNLRIEQFDLEEDFSTFGHFDVIINFALLMHLKNVDEHLRCCFRVGQHVVLETIVADSTDPGFIKYFDENAQSAGNAIRGVGAKMSPFYVERVARESGFDMHRHFDADLNVERYLYDWQHKNTDDDWRDGYWWLRRFWHFERSKTPAETMLAP